MALRINTNISALNAHKNMIRTDNSLSNSLQRLSSGLRINKAADDASGMTIADSLKSQALGLGQAIKNGNDAINIVQTADAALEESINIVNTIKTKSIQAAQDGQTTESRAAIQADIDKLMEELDNIAKTTSFNGQKLLSGNFSDKKFQIGAYSGETINISIGSTQSNQVGHTTTGKLVLENNAPGNVALAFYSSLQNENFEIEATEVKYNNSRENSLGMVADSINRLSDVLGITATADVRSTTDNIVGAGTLEKFSINGVEMNGVNVVEGDTNRALTSAINEKTAQHGVVASIQQGHLTLTSRDGRAIKVEGDEKGLREVFNGQEMSTIGHINLTQKGSNDIIVTNIDGGDAIQLVDDMNIRGAQAFTQDSIVQAGSTLAAGSVLAAGWTTSQDIVGNSAFGAALSTTENSTLARGSVAGSGSTLAFNGLVNGFITLEENSSALSQDSTLLRGSTLASGSILAVGSTIGAGTQLVGNMTIGATGTSYEDDTIASGSVLGKGTVLAAGTQLASGGSFIIDTTGPTTGDSIFMSGGSLAAGSVVAKGTELFAGKVSVNATEMTTRDSTLASGGVLAAGSFIGTGTTLSSGVAARIGESDPLSLNTLLSGTSELSVGTIIKEGSIIGSGVTLTYASGEGTATFTGTGEAITFDVRLTAAVAVSGTTLVAGSKLEAGTVVGSGATVHANVTLQEDYNTSGAANAMTLAAGSKLAGGSIVSSGSTIYADLTLKSSATANNTMTLKAGSILAKQSQVLGGAGSGSIAADITLVNASTLTNNAGMTAKAGSSYGQDTTMNSGSIVHANITLAQSVTLNGDIVAGKETTLGRGSMLGKGSVIMKGSTFHGNVKLANAVGFDGSQTLGAGSSLAREGTLLKAGSTVGGELHIGNAMDIENDGFKLAAGTTLAAMSMLSNGSSIGGNVSLAEDEKVAADGKMELRGGSVLAEGSTIATGTYLTNDIQANDGTVYKAGTILEKDIVTRGENLITRDMTLTGGSVITQGSVIAGNDDKPAATAKIEDMQMERLSEINVLTQEGAQKAISIADSTLKNLDKIRADLGSVQNQLSSTISNISTTRVNVFSAESTIRDVDFADESSNFTKMQVLQQAGTFAMSQANASAQSVLSLLQ